jgi:hypothetical protein
MKRMVFSILAFMVCFVFLGCPSDAGEDAPWLADLSNPFLGKWQSDIPSAGTILTFDYKADGTFDYVMAGVPAEQGGIGTGGYLVKGDKLISFLSGDGGVSGYVFKVVDNDTIDVTEIDDVDETTGALTLGNTAPFTRAADSTVNKDDKPFALNNTLIGTWNETSTSYQASYEFKADGTGTFTYTAGGQSITDELSYVVIDDAYLDDVLVTFVPKYNSFTAYSFTKDDDSITVKEIIEITMTQTGPQATYETPVTFTRNQ